MLLGARGLHQSAFPEEQLVVAEEDREHRHDRRNAEHATDGDLGGARALDARDQSGAERENERRATWRLRVQR